MGVRKGRPAAVLVLAAALAAGVLSACGGNGTDADGTGGASEVGVVTDLVFHGHPLREVPAEGAPSLQLEVEPDPHGGWNLRLRSERFTFTPDQTGAQARAGQGHAHVYVDEAKFSRAYGQWFYLPAEAVGDGEHTVLVTLNANDHTVWAVDGEPVSAAATVTGTTDGHGHASATPTAPASPAEDVQLLEFDIADGQASPPLDRVTVDRGTTVRIVVTGDQPDELHLHGYDLSARIGPGEQGVIEFVADQTGLFELETHDTALVLLQLQVQ
ncbi:MAG: hypothetical protein ACRDT2_15385 [Natronosporangium sp.]